MRTKHLILTVFLMCECFCLSACNDWRDYSLDFQPGSFHICAYEDHSIFTSESKIILSLTEPLDAADAFAAFVDYDIYFIFYHVADGVEKIDYGYAAERSITFYAEMSDSNDRNFTLYAYDWTDKIYCMGYDFYFEAE